MFQKPFLPFLLIAVALGFAGPLPAQIIFDDTSSFGNWYQGVTNTSNLLVKDANNISWTVSSTQNEARQVFGRTYSTVALNPGDTLRFTFDWTMTNASASIFRVGLFDVSASITNDGALGTSGTGGGTLGAFAGYASFFRDGSGSGNVARDETGTNTGFGNDRAPLTGFTAPNTVGIGTNTQNFNLVDDGTVTYQVLFEVRYNTNGSQVETFFAIQQSSTNVMTLTGTDTATLRTSFDSVFIRQDGNSTGLYDNLRLEVIAIPEPATCALFLGGLGALALRRLRRR